METGKKVTCKRGEHLVRQKKHFTDSNRLQELGAQRLMGTSGKIDQEKSIKIQICK